VRQGDCSFSEFHVKWLGEDSDSWVPECDIDPELVAAYRAQRRDQPLPSSSPCMASAPTAITAGSSTLSSSSATKSSSSATFSTGRGKAFKPSRSNVAAREHVSFCSQLTPVALERPTQANDGFLSPAVNGSLLAGTAFANGASAMAASSLFCSPTAVAYTHVDLNCGESSNSSSSSSQSQLQLGVSSVASTQHPSAHTTPPASQKSSLSVEFPPSFPYRLSQQEPAALTLQPHVNDVMDIGDYCVGMLPSLCSGNVLVQHEHAPPRLPPSLASAHSTVVSACLPSPPSSRNEERVCVVRAVGAAADVTSMEGLAACDASARKRKRVVASRNLGACVVHLFSVFDMRFCWNFEFSSSPLQDESS
jgi:hypothetical protein